MSAWGKSWGKAWGSAWGAIQAAVSGGVGHKRSKRVYLERDGQILVFAKPTHAAEYLAYEKARNQPVIDFQKPAKDKARPHQVKPTHAPETSFRLDVLQYLVKQYQLNDVIEQLIAQREYEALLSLYQLAIKRRDEDDIELLLLAA